MQIINDGKDIILQRLRNSSVPKHLRYVEKETRNKIFDFLSPKYNLFRGENVFKFKKIKKSDFLINIEEKKKPEWISTTKFEKIINEEEENKKIKLIDAAINSYDEKTNKKFSELTRLSDRQKEYHKEKGETNTYFIEFLITGRLTTGEDVRFPLMMQEISKININSQEKSVDFVPGDNFKLNLPFLTWLANKTNVNIEAEIKKIGEMDRQKCLEKGIELLKFFGINLSTKNFDDCKEAELKTRRENKSGVIDKKIANHESCHLVTALDLGLSVDSININNCERTLGSLEISYDVFDDNEYNINLILISPYVFEKEITEKSRFSDLKKLSDQTGQSDLKKIIGFINETINIENEKDLFVKELWKKSQQIMSKHGEKIKVFSTYLQKHKFMDDNQIEEQFESNVLIEEFFKPIDEIKIEKNAYFIEKVKLIGQFKELCDHQIFLDVKEIFEKTNFIEEFNTKPIIKRKKVYSESAIDWGFNSDFSQQKSVFESQISEKFIIQGPPGTGKTQTILNIICDNLSKNKKILVVTEKITAVQVIYDRIMRDAYDLHYLVLDLFNHNNGIYFYNEIGRKSHQKWNSLKKQKNYNSPFFDNNEKVKKIENILEFFDEINYNVTEENFGLKLKKNELEIIKKFYFDLFKSNFDESKSKKFFIWLKNQLNKNLFDELQEMERKKPNDFESTILKNFSEDTLKRFVIFSSEKIDQFIKYKKEKEKLTEFEKKFITISCTQEKINNLLKFNSDLFFTKDATYKYIHFIVTGKEKTYFWHKIKYKKFNFEKEFIENIFSNNANVSLLKEWNNFDFKKYDADQNEIETYINIRNNISQQRVKEVLEYDESVIDRISTLIKLSSEIDNERLDEILKFYDFFEMYNKYKNAYRKIEIEKFNSINDKQMFSKIHEKIVSINIENRKNIFKRMDYTDVVLFNSLEGRKILNSRMEIFLKEKWKYLHELFPCVLSTPETVSKYIPLKEGIYDVVIIDEASQFLIEKAIPSLYRGKQKFVSGDKNQLRPSIEGQRFDSISVNGAKNCRNIELIESESILDYFDAQLTDLNKSLLKVHYRSERKELIDFSNQNFYKNELRFIEAIDVDKNYPVIEIFDVNGEWIEQTNKIEAEKIIEILKNLYKNEINLSVGVILFSKKQANLIKKMINCDSQNILIKAAMEGEDDSYLFVKSLDEVQGEERDIIIFGVTYGKNTHSYGLLNQKYGENRINVAVTRAKKKILIVKSHKANEYKQQEANGVKSLLSYLEYAENIDINNENTENKIQIPEILKMYFIKNEIENNKVDNAISLNGEYIYFCQENAYLVLNTNSLKDPRENIWMLLELLQEKGYKTKIVSVFDIY